MNPIAKASEIGMSAIIGNSVCIETILNAIGATMSFDHTLISKNLVCDMNYKNDQFTIHLNPEELIYYPRLRIVTALMIGHHFLHSKGCGKNDLFNYNSKSLKPEKIYWNSKSSSAYEFAINMLMPKSIVDSAVKGYLDSKEPGPANNDLIMHIMSIFEVPSKDAIKRLENLGYIN